MKLSLVKPFFVTCILVLLPAQASKPIHGQTERNNTSNQITPPVSASPVYKPSVENPVRPGQNAEGQQEEKPTAFTRPEVLQISISGLLTLIVFWQLIIYIQQRNVAWRSERAYVGVDTLQFIRPLVPGEPPAVLVVFRNAGRTPAWAFTSGAGLVVSNKPIAEVIKENPVPRPVADLVNFVPAGATRRVDFEMRNIRLTQEAISDIANGTVRLFVMGSVQFRDFRKKQRVFRFRSFYDPASNSFFEAGYD
ncbi:MAG TPA: hypothetical protein VHE60_09225 [Pyrinomonadaceae bacterium]|nr:hypothetical protein [Pyrinomonadaceae bacterium]